MQNFLSNSQTHPIDSYSSSITVHKSPELLQIPDFQDRLDTIWRSIKPFIKYYIILSIPLCITYNFFINFTYAYDHSDRKSWYSFPALQFWGEHTQSQDKTSYENFQIVTEM